MEQIQNKKRKIDKEQQQPQTIEEININEIDVDKLYKLRKGPVIKIAESLGIQRTSASKNELISNIMSLVDKKHEIKIKEQQALNNNSFNKINQLNITNDIEPLESLFWKIFRNKSIYRNIMSFMDKVYSVPYECIIDLSKMLENNQISMIKDKVKIGQHLKLITGYSSRNYSSDGYFKDISTMECEEYYYTDNLWSDLFSRITDDKLFYQRFFKNYGKYLPLFQDNKSFISRSIIKAGCLVALEVLIEDYSYTPKKQCLEVAIHYDRIQIIDLFLQEKFGLLDTIKTTTTASTTTPTDTIIKISNQKETIPQSKLLDENREVDFLAYSLINLLGYHTKKRLKTFKLLVEKYQIIKLPIPPLNLIANYIDPYNDHCSHRKTYRYLIRAVEIIEILGILNYSSKDYYQYKHTTHNIKNDYQTIIKESNTIFSQEQLKSRLSDPINYKSQQKDQIKQLLEVYYFIDKHSEHPILTNSSSASMVLYDFLEKDCENIEYKTKEFAIGVCLEYGNTEITKFCNLKNFNFRCNYKYKGCFLKCLKKDESGGITKEIEVFINLMMDMAPKETIQMAIESDNLNVIKYCCDKLTPEIKSNCGSMVPFISSTQLLDYLYTEHKVPFLDNPESTFQNYQLVKHYQKLEPNNFSKFKIPITIETIINESIEYNSIDEKMKYSNVVQRLIYNSKILEQLKTEQHQLNYIAFIEYIKKENIDKNFNILNYVGIGTQTNYHDNNIDFIPKHIVNYLINYYEKEYKPCNGDITKLPNINLACYLLYSKCCKDNDYTQFINFILTIPQLSHTPHVNVFNLSKAIDLIVNRNNFKVLDLILKNATKSKESMKLYKLIIYKITKLAISSDQISILEFIFLNYSNVFKKAPVLKKMHLHRLIQPQMMMVYSLN